MHCESYLQLTMAEGIMNTRSIKYDIKCNMMYITKLMTTIYSNNYNYYYVLLCIMKVFI